MDLRFQSKAYRSSAYELRHRKRDMLANEAAEPNPTSGYYKPFEHPEEFQVGARAASSGWQSTGLQPGPVGREGYEPSADELN